MGGDDWAKYTILPGHTKAFTGFEKHWVRFEDGRKHSKCYWLVAGSTNQFRWSNGTLDLINK